MGIFIKNNNGPIEICTLQGLYTPSNFWKGLMDVC